MWSTKNAIAEERKMPFSSFARLEQPMTGEDLALDQTDSPYVPVAEALGFLVYNDRLAFTSDPATLIFEKWGWFNSAPPPKVWRRHPLAYALRCHLVERKWKTTEPTFEDAEKYCSHLRNASEHRQQPSPALMCRELLSDLRDWSISYWERERVWKQAARELLGKIVSGEVELVGDPYQLQIRRGNPIINSQETEIIRPIFFADSRCTLERTNKSGHGFREQKMVYRNIKISSADIEKLKPFFLNGWTMSC